MADKKSRGILFIVAGFMFEIVGIVMMVGRTVSPAIAIALIAIGLSMVGIGLGVLRRDRDEHGLKRPQKPL